MTEQEKLYFERLSRDRAESAEMLEKPSMRGIKSSVVDKYSDQAHFIYELLQNADDTNATKARFIVEKDRLIFAHNGTRLFSVSDPDMEELDSQNGNLGDINAITSIANSNKTEASIGKFGVGFKAVFQYTTTPYIYDPIFHFKIERFIVPIILEEDFPGREEKETLFVFPFDHPGISPKTAYNDISRKLNNLSYPLLFLSNLNNIEFYYGNVSGSYSKEVIRSYKNKDILAEKIRMQKVVEGNTIADSLWLFSRKDKSDRLYSVGFFINDEGKLRPVHEPAFCYFPTKEITGLNFIVHAPFLLTDSREGIRAGIRHNNLMVYYLAELSADALVYLKEIGLKEKKRIIDDGIMDIIPINANDFNDVSDTSKISFLPFYEKIHETFSTEEILPTKDGYTNSYNGYWAAATQLPELFSDYQLSDICENEKAKWVFVSLGRDDIIKNNRQLLSYIDSIVRTNLNEDSILRGRNREVYYNPVLGVRQPLENIKGITESFIENQTIEWLHSFYKWISETKHRMSVIMNRPVFLNQHKKACPAFDKEGQPVLFLPVNNIDLTNYSVVLSRLLENDETKKFIDEIGIKEPTLRDQIYNIILPLCQKEDAEITDSHFMLIFDYYCGCSINEADEFVDLIRKYAFLKYYLNDDYYQHPHNGVPDSLFFPTQELKSYFETCKEIRFVDFDNYKKLVGSEKEEELHQFFLKLGVKSEVDYLVVNVDSYTRDDIPTPHSTMKIRYEETIIHGCKEIIQYISNRNDRSKSILLWNILLEIIKNKSTQKTVYSLSTLLTGTCYYFFRRDQQEQFTSSDALALRDKRWVFDVNGNFVAPSKLSRSKLSNEYDCNSVWAEELLDFLEIIEEKEENDDYLTESQREKINLANKLLEYGIENEADLEEFKKFKSQRDAVKKSSERSEKKKNTIDSIEKRKGDLPKNDESITDEYENQIVDSINTYLSSEQGEKLGISKTKTGVVRNIVKKTRELSTRSWKNNEEKHDSDEVDYDELIPATVDYNKQIEQAIIKSAREVEEITHLEELQNKVLSSIKYSYAWFKTLLEMESEASNKAQSSNKEVTLNFNRVEREPGTNRTLVLKQPDRYIPQFVEDLADIPLVLHWDNQTKTVAIEVANIKSYSLRVKLKSGVNIEEVDLSRIQNASISVKSPTFLLEELRREFESLNYEDDFNMQENLCENIRFIFGPPGTGKTTYLARNILMPFMNESISLKILVLTPTNKAADVLVKRIMESFEQNRAYEEWLVRFGTTGDETIEDSKIYKDKTFDIRTMKKNVTVTTIARFPYDYFMPRGERLYLRAINWDYIVIDEASMIPIANIVYPLYKKTPKEFIIAGDPFQIKPITAVAYWKDENIYSMVHLNSFGNAKTIPYNYDIKLLTTQYRSVPEIGQVFSEFSYNGILKHYRNSYEQKKIKGIENIGIKTINILKYPVSKYESIYKPKRLKHSSSYQIYSALFTFEYIVSLSKIIATYNPEKAVSIGVIAPYRAQADMIEKLLLSEEFPPQITVQAGTIHGFQGDECDMIFAVFNTPPVITDSREMFLNKQNIINVSISRARDYLFLIMPDDNTENINNLFLVKRVEKIIEARNDWVEFLTPDLENKIFGEKDYLENNAFSTGHQSVNVYGLPEKSYEVRSEDTAVDVQIHRNSH